MIGVAPASVDGVAPAAAPQPVRHHLKGVVGGFDSRENSLIRGCRRWAMTAQVETVPGFDARAPAMVNGCCHHHRGELADWRHASSWVKPPVAG
jgi:hypothetical protein